MSPDRPVPVEVDGERLALSNLGKVLYPQAGFSKAEVIDYYRRVAPVLLPHLAGRPLTVRRFPDGVDGTTFYEKNAPSHTPAWVRRVRLPSPGSGRDRETIDYIVVDRLATLVHLANLAALELHVPMWRVDGAGRPLPPDTLVVDLDPGAPAAIRECAEVALRVRAALQGDGLAPVPKTSGGKGLQLYAPLAGDRPWRDVHGYARALAERLEREDPALVVSVMAKERRRGRVLVDWSQNNPAKTTVAPYSLRARPVPAASTPVDWDEVAAAADGAPLAFTAPDVLRRVEADGDLFAAVLGPGATLP